MFLKNIKIRMLFLISIGAIIGLVFQNCDQPNYEFSTSEGLLNDEGIVTDFIQPESLSLVDEDELIGLTDSSVIHDMDLNNNDQNLTLLPETIDDINIDPAPQPFPGLCLIRNFDVSVIDGDAVMFQPVTPFRARLNSKLNYNYYSHSAHPIIGPESMAYEANLFLYEGVDGLMLYVIFNKDQDGSEDNFVELKITTTGNDLKDKVVLSDDFNEIKSFKEGSKTNYISKFHYFSNTDGAVIGPFTNEDFKINIEVVSLGDIKNIGFYSGDGGDIEKLIYNENSLPSLKFIIEQNSSSITHCDTRNQPTEEQNKCIHKVAKIYKDRLHKVDTAHIRNKLRKKKQKFINGLLPDKKKGEDSLEGLNGKEKATLSKRHNDESRIKFKKFLKEQAKLKKEFTKQVKKCL